MPFYLAWIYRKGQRTKFFFRFSTLLSNIFAPYIQKLETSYFFKDFKTFLSCVHGLKLKTWIKLIYDKITYTYCGINEFNPTFEIQKMGEAAFPYTSFGNTSFPNGNKGSSCLWAYTNLCTQSKLSHSFNVFYLLLCT